MKFLVMGSQGYIGSVLIPELLKWVDRGGEVKVSSLVAVDNIMFNQCVNPEACMDSRYKFIRQDVTDFDKMITLYDEADVIINLACLTGMDICEQNKAQAWAVNYDVVKNMTDYLKESNQLDKILVWPCSSSSYGIQPKGVWATEEMETIPISTYAQTKVLAEKHVIDYSGVSLRLCTCFGIGGGFHRVGLLVNTFTYDGVKNGIINIFESSFMRSYLWVNDAVQAIMLSVDKYDIARGKVYNVGDNEAVLSKGDLAYLVARYTGCKVIEVQNKEDSDKRSYSVDSAKITGELGFTPGRSIDDVIHDLIKYYASVDERSANVLFLRT